MNPTLLFLFARICTVSDAGFEQEANLAGLGSPPGKYAPNVCQLLRIGWRGGNGKAFATRGIADAPYTVTHSRLQLVELP